MVPVFAGQRRQPKYLPKTGPARIASTELPGTANDTKLIVKFDERPCRADLLDIEAAEADALEEENGDQAMEEKESE